MIQFLKQTQDTWNLVVMLQLPSYVISGKSFLLCPEVL